MNEDPEAPTASAGPSKATRSRPGVATLAAVLALAALLLAAWSTWHLRRIERADAAARKQDTAALTAIQDRLAAGAQQTQTNSQRLDKLAAGLEDERAAAQGLDKRVANLETAITSLSGQQQSASDTVLLNDAEMLLRTGAQRYELFHDTAGALKAYSQAIEVLGQVQNPVYAPVRASATTERDALAAAAPPSRQAALDTLSGLRSSVGSLPLVATGPAGAASTAPPGFWSRVGRAFSGVVTVTRDAGGSAPLPDPRFARQTLSLDLAQAQEALLAFDDPTYRAALQRAEATLSAQFDAHDAGVEAARAHIANLLAQRGGGTAPTLGGALAQLQSLRGGQPPASAPPASSPGAPASSARSAH